MKNLRAFGGVFGAAALILAGCGQPAVESQEFVSSVEVPETVRLHFTTFSKSKSGAT